MMRMRTGSWRRVTSKLPFPLFPSLAYSKLMFFVDVREMQMSDNDAEEIEAADKQIEREQRKRKDRRKQREYSVSSDSDKEDKGGQGAVRRRMVVDESDDE